MTDKALQQLLDQQGNIVDFLRNQQVGPNAYPGVPAEYFNWRDEQLSWANSCVLFNQSFHMVDLLVTGPDAVEMLHYLTPWDPGYGHLVKFDHDFVGREALGRVMVVPGGSARPATPRVDRVAGRGQAVDDLRPRVRRVAQLRQRDRQRPRRNAIDPHHAGYAAHA